MPRPTRRTPDPGDGEMKISDDRDTPRVDPYQVYIRNLSPDDRALYEETSGDLSLVAEIRLMRVVLARLCVDLLGNHVFIRQVISALGRVVFTQGKQAGSASDIERDLRAAAEDVLKEHEA